MSATNGAGKSVIFLLAAGLLVGAISGGVGELLHVYKFRPSEAASSQAYDFQRLNKELRLAESKNVAVTYGLLGALIGAVFGLVGGLRDGRPSRRSLSGLLGGILGAAGPVGLAFVLVPYYMVNQDPSATDLTLPFMIHGGLWLPIGFAAGLAFGIGAGKGGDAARGAIGGLVGAAIGTGVYELLGAVLFPTDRTVQPIAQEMPGRLFAHVAVATCVALGLVMLREVSTKRSAPPVEVAPD